MRETGIETTASCLPGIIRVLRKRDPIRPRSTPYPSSPLISQFRSSPEVYFRAHMLLFADSSVSKLYADVLVVHSVLCICHFYLVAGPSIFRRVCLKTPAQHTAVDVTPNLLPSPATHTMRTSGSVFKFPLHDIDLVGRYTAHGPKGNIKNHHPTLRRPCRLHIQALYTVCRRYGWAEPPHRYA